MAFAIIHIIIAERVLKYIPEICDYSTYILGTIAPDAVHANFWHNDERRNRERRY